MQMAAPRFRQCEAGIGRMEGVVDVERLVRVGGAGDALHNLVEHARNDDRTCHPLFLETDRLRLDAEEGADERRQACHRAARLTAPNRDERRSVLGCRALVGDEGYLPVTLVHPLRGVSYDDETEIVEGQRPMLAAIHMEDEAKSQ